ncbi:MULTISPECIES: polysialyltransferase family glycosyltransferase [unclassified Streptomyces]|uniref:polysialyltransferase family glycosyltransferase n=1 Tax=unclassified Streptomyces TaxID=2593676 RepID=UPI0035D6F720
MTTQIFVASGLRGTALLAAALDSGCFDESRRRVLLLCDTTAVPEAAAPVAADPGFGRLRARFDEVRSWNDAVFPLHPAAWSPRPDDVPLWERHLRRAWDLGDEEVELALESPHTGPSRALAQVFTGGPVTVYTDGLTGYGPTPGKVPPLIGTRVRQLLHPDLLPGLKPLLLGEFGVPPRAVPTNALRKVFGEMADAAAGTGAPEGCALLLLPETGTLPVAEEAELRLRMVRGTAALGHTRLVVVPHPRGSDPVRPALRAEAARLGASLAVPEPGPAEVLLERLRPALVVGCSSTALVAAATHHGLPVARTGTGTLLANLTPYENPARVPATIVDALLPGLAGPEDVPAGSPVTAATVAEALDGLLPAVAFAMQPRVRPDLRPAAERYLSERLDARTWRYFRRRRLGSLALPGVVPARLAFVRRSPALRRLARRARALGRR